MALAKSLTSTCTGELALLLAILLFMALTMSLAIFVCKASLRDNCNNCVTLWRLYLLLTAQLSFSSCLAKIFNVKCNKSKYTTYANANV